MASKKRTLTPAVRYLRYELTTSGTPGTETSHFVNLARDISAVNRRLYRSGKDYFVKKITVISSNTPNGGNRISVSAIPDSWTARAAFNRGFKTWNKMQNEAQSQAAGDIKATWNDFKVDMSVDFRSATLLTPKDNGGNDVTVGEWIQSRMVSPDGTTGEDYFNLHMLGNHDGAVGAWGSVGLIKSYGESRATVNAGDPNVPGTVSDDPLVNVFDYGTTIDEVIQDMESHNDLPPYDITDYVGGDANMPKPIVLQDTTIVDGRGTMGGFNALLGQLEFEVKSSLPSDVYSILVELAPGNYRGIKAEAI
ncbi:MAG: putative capsid protein [Circoviridae sp.]|nr:MAG: putative capsid protein [Circoviridae sp.]